METRRLCDSILYIWKGKYHQRILYPEKLFLKNESKDTSRQKKENLLLANLIHKNTKEITTDGNLNPSPSIVHSGNPVL